MQAFFEVCVCSGKPVAFKPSLHIEHPDCVLFLVVAINFIAGVWEEDADSQISNAVDEQEVRFYL